MTCTKYIQDPGQRETLPALCPGGSSTGASQISWKGPCCWGGVPQHLSDWSGAALAGLLRPRHAHLVQERGQPRLHPLWPDQSQLRTLKCRSWWKFIFTFIFRSRGNKYKNSQRIHIYAQKTNIAKIKFCLLFIQLLTN